MIRSIETKEFVRRHNPKTESKADKQRKIAQIIKSLREIQASKRPGKERINMLVDEIIDLTALL